MNNLSWTLLSDGKVVSPTVQPKELGVAYRYQCKDGHSFKSLNGKPTEILHTCQVNEQWEKTPNFDPVACERKGKKLLDF